MTDHDASTPPAADSTDPLPPAAPITLHVALAKVRELGPVVGALAILSLTIPAIVGFFVLGGSLVKPEAIRSGLASLGMGAPFAAAAAFAILTGCALAPTYAFSFAAGAIFSDQPILVPAAVAMFGVTAGAVIGFLIATFLARERVMRTIEADPRAAIIRAALLDRGILTETFVITLIRIPPNSPFALTNFTLAATRANPVAYLLGTAIGIAPRTLFAVWLGVEAGDLAAAGSKPRGAAIVGIVVAVVVFILLYRLFTTWARDALKRQLSHAPPSSAA